MVEILAGHRVGQEGQCGTIQEDSYQELACVVMEKIYTEEISMEAAQGVSGTSSGSVAVTGESSSGGRSLPVNVLGNGSGGASSGGQASAYAGEERPSLSSTFQPFCGGYGLTWSSRTV